MSIYLCAFIRKPLDRQLLTGSQQKGAPKIKNPFKLKTRDQTTLDQNLDASAM
jgi:hypothetical protein